MKQKGTVRSFWGPFNQIHRFRGGGVTSDKEVYTQNSLWNSYGFTS